MRHLILCLIVCLSGITITSQAQPSPEVAPYNSTTIIWQGFQYEWKYDNHRYKRMGSYVSASVHDDSARYAAEIVNTAASGFGADVMNYATYFTKVKTQDVFFDTQDAVILELVACEPRIKIKNDKPGVEFAGKFSMDFPLPENMQQLEHYTAFLNGFDLYHARKKTGKDSHPTSNAVIDLWSEALKFSQLDLRIDSLSINQEQQQYTITFAVSVTADCKSPECNKRQKSCLDYVFNLPFTLAAGNADALHLSPETSLKNAYSWPTEVRENEFKKRKSKRKDYYARRYHPNEILPENLSTSFSVADVDVKYLIPTITGFGFETNTSGQVLTKSENAYHLAGLKMGLIPRKGHRNGQAVYHFDYSLFFKQWLTDMRFFAHANPGSVRLDMDIAPIQFLKPTQAISDQTEGQMRWKTNPIIPLSAKSGKAVKRNLVKIE